METPLEPSLDKLRDKTLSFGCYILGKSENRNGDIETEVLRFVCNEEEKDYQPRRMHVNSDEWSFFNADEGLDYDIIGHPLSWGRICYVYFNFVFNTPSELVPIECAHAYCDISELFLNCYELNNQDEIGRQTHEYWPELLKLLQELQKYL